MVRLSWFVRSAKVSPAPSKSARRASRVLRRWKRPVTPPPARPSSANAPRRPKAASRIEGRASSPRPRAPRPFATIHHVQLGRTDFVLLRSNLPRRGTTAGWTSYRDFLRINDYRNVPALLAQFTEYQLELAPRLRQGGNPELDMQHKSLQDKWWMYIIFQDGDDQPQLSAIAHVVGKDACSKHIMGQLVALGMIASNADLERQLRSGRYSVESCHVLCAGLMRFFPTHIYVDNLSGTYAPSSANLERAVDMLSAAFDLPFRGVSQKQLVEADALPRWWARSPRHPDALEVEEDRRRYAIEMDPW